MVLLNIIYGFIMALVLVLSYMIMTRSADFYEHLFVYVWATWSIGHIIYDAVAYRVVRLFNKDHDVYKG